MKIHVFPAISMCEAAFLRACYACPVQHVFFMPHVLREAMQGASGSLAEHSAGKERDSDMKHTKAILFAAACGGLLLTGCGSHNRGHAETTDRGARAVVTTVKTEAREEHHTLYESDDVHRETASEPDIVDRAETALDDAKDKAKEMMTDAKRAVSDAAADMTETDRLR